MVNGMQYRGVVLPHGLVFFCIASLFVLGLFVVPAIAQDTGAGPPAGTPGTDTNQQPTDDNIGGDNNANAAQDQSNAADAQYADDVIKGAIPDKKILVDTGGPILPIIGGVILAMGLVGLGIFLLRRT